MSSLVVYHTNYGNTKIIAETIAQNLGTDSRAESVAQFDPNMLEGINLLVVGAPVIAWRPSGEMKKFLSSLKSGQLKNIKAACFDTRIKTRFSGDAAHKIAKALKKAGADIVANPEAFIVKDKEGPLAEGEEERACSWASIIADQAKI